MSDEIPPGASSSPPDPGAVPSEWSPPASSLPAPPAMAPPASPLTPPGVVVSTGPVMADAPSRPRWFGRGVALVAAAVLVGGGGYLAINAGSADGGAGTPEGALEGALAALSAEDLIGAAEFVEPTERETMIDAGLEVVEELVRLEVFDETLDLAAVDGIDLEFDDVEVEVEVIRSGLAHLYVVGGTSTSSIDGSAVPFGPLVTDRVDDEDLAVEERHTEPLARPDIPIVAVERDGRWYLSLWYTVAEGARLELGRPLPGTTDRLAEIGADTPERAVENFVGALEQLDIATMIGLLDPLEASALYDYGSLFVDEAQDGVDGFLRDVRREGWYWEVTRLDLRSETEGSQATVFVDRLDISAEGPDVSVDGSFAADRVEFTLESPEVDLDVLVDGDCVTITFDEGYGAETERMCGDELLDDAGIGSLGTGAMGGVTTIDDVGIVVRDVGGRWYISPIRTGSEMMLQSIRALDADMLAETVDGLIDLVNDPFAFGTSFDEPLFGGDVLETPTPTTTVVVDDFPVLTRANADLLVDGPEFVFVYDLVDIYRGDIWWDWLADVEERDFGDGVVGQAFLDNDAYVDILVLAGIDVASDVELADWLSGEVVVSDGFGFVTVVNSWGTELIAARSADGIAIVAMYDGYSDEALAALRNQVGG